jgi:hypothetical protein
MNTLACPTNAQQPVTGPGRVKTLYRSLGRVARGRLLPEWPF